MEVVEKHLGALELFNEKADRLLGSAFVDALLSPKAGVTISVRKQENGSFEMSSQRRGPSQEEVDAFVLTLRFFIQDNETSSLRNIGAIYEEIGDDDGFLSRFNSARNGVNQLLDSPNLMNITFNDWRPTNRDVMETFVYGGLAHANPEKRRVLKAWMGSPPESVLFQFCFTQVLGEVLRAISFIRDLNEEVTSNLKSS